MKRRCGCMAYTTEILHSQGHSSAGDPWLTESIQERGQRLTRNSKLSSKCAREWLLVVVVRGRGGPRINVMMMMTIIKLIVKGNPPNGSILLFTRLQHDYTHYLVWVAGRINPCDVRDHFYQSSVFILLTSSDSMVQADRLRGIKNIPCPKMGVFHPASESVSHISVIQFQ